MRTLLAKKTIWMYITIGMILLPGMLVNNARGVGGPPKCSTCTKWQYDGIDWGCYGYNPCPSPQECCPDVGCYNRLTSCKGCDNNGEHLLSYCLASDCATCDGSTGSCKICDGNEYQRCCGGKCYDIRTHGCCSGQIYSYNDCEICNYEVEVPVPVCICDYEPNAYCCGDGHCCHNDKECCPPNACCNPKGCNSFACQQCVNGGCQNCLYKVTTWAELEKCSKVDDPTTEPIPNGCSSPFGNNPAGCWDTDFGNDCNQHDTCYQSCNTDGTNRKAICDETLSSSMLRVCDNASHGQCQDDCYTWAYNYTMAIQGALGQKSYNDDQINACACCNCN